MTAFIFTKLAILQWKEKEKTRRNHGYQDTRCWAHGYPKRVPGTERIQTGLWFVGCEFHKTWMMLLGWVGKPSQNNRKFLAQLSVKMKNSTLCLTSRTDIAKAQISYLENKKEEIYPERKEKNTRSWQKMLKTLGQFSRCNVCLEFKKDKPKRTKEERICP